MKIKDILINKDGIVKGPFGGDIKKAYFVPKNETTYKVYEQSVVYNSDFQQGSYYISEEHFNKKLKRFEIKEKDILMTGAGTLGELYEIPANFERGIINQALIRIRLNEKIISSNYFKYYFKYYIKNIICNINGDSVIPNLPPLSILKEIEIEIPDLPVQQSIANVLSSLDEKIELNNKINAELETLAKTIYDYWFVQFEFPDKNGKPYKSSGGAMVYNEKLKREIPQGWKDGKLVDLINNEKGGDWGKETAIGNYTEQVICIRGTDFPGLLGRATLNAPKRFMLTKNINKQLVDGDIIIEISGGSPNQSTGRICYITNDVLTRFDLPVITSNFCKAFNLKNRKWQYWFYLLWIKFYNSGIFFKYEGKTTGIKNLLFDVICRDYKIINPEENVMINFNNYVSPLFKKIQKNNNENQQLTALRDWLLPMLMNGQVILE